ncbi:hypothetical protein PIB30_068008 [Stylosanthes scabra]|uniref:Uncharacterized protein n=1 Tax=Stylosanthes scabra TaxID=79078 RepID=A0ABU6XKL5_9FABA|nr:hypothetical protein [Stylosanthes scabra]
MCQATEDNEGNELKEDQFEWDIGIANEVKELKGYGKIGNCNEKVTDFLANQDALDAPNPFLIITRSSQKFPKPKPSQDLNTAQQPQPQPQPQTVPYPYKVNTLDLTKLTNKTSPFFQVLGFLIQVERN